MYKFKDIGIAHVELSSNCQASCPMCARNQHGGQDNPLLKVQDIDLDLFMHMMPMSFISQLHTVILCGNFGDPLLAKDLLSIVSYIKDANPKIKLDIHTNGSLRNTAWWKQLAHVVPIDHIVQFGIDGLADTHALYRVGTDFDKIIENAKTFIDAGGIARWNFITFKHNEHQLESARQMAKDLGFNSFYEKQTSRFIGNPWFDVHDKEGNVTYQLENPTEQKLLFVDSKTVKNYREVIKMASIECEVEQTRSIYIDALGYLYPCCWVGATPYLYSQPGQLIHEYSTDSQASLQTILDRFGGLEYFNLRNYSVEEIIDSKAWQTIWNESFTGNKLHVCARQCGKFPEPTISQCRDQFLELENFNE
jgi:MoaA/NifB/PqqE/SkfB family radical SAM enzyme